MFLHEKISTELNMRYDFYNVLKMATRRYRRVSGRGVRVTRRQVTVTSFWKCKSLEVILQLRGRLSHRAW